MSLAVDPIDFHGLPAWRLQGPQGAQAIVSRFGGQVLSWQTPDGRERLYLSPQARFDGQQAIRGGVPVCFPQFGTRGDLPRHGLLRTRDWSHAGQRVGEDYVLLTLETRDDPETRRHWPHPFRAELTVMLEADRLDLEFCVENTGEAPLAFTGALHTYLRVTQVEDVALEGLQGHTYEEASSGEVRRDSGTELQVEGPVDRIYRDLRRPLWLKAGNFSLGLHSRGFADLVVWNPWVEGAAALADLPDDGWRHFLCLEAAAVERPVEVPPGEEWYGRQTLVVV